MTVSRSGLFIAIEGGEGAGKSTLASALSDRLTAVGFSTLATREPGGTNLGKKLRQVWIDHAARPADIDGYESLFLFAADRHAHLRQVIRPALSAGKLVITDRYVYSAKAYQASEGVEEPLVNAVCDYATGGLVPHMTYWLDVEPTVGLARIASDTRIENPSKYDLAKLDFHERVYAEFKKLQQRSPEIITRVDGNRPAEQVLEDIFQDVLRVSETYHYHT